MPEDEDIAQQQRIERLSTPRTQAAVEEDDDDNDTDDGNAESFDDAEEIFVRGVSSDSSSCSSNDHVGNRCRRYGNIRCFTSSKLW